MSDKWIGSVGNMKIYPFDYQLLEPGMTFLVAGEAYNLGGFTNEGRMIGVSSDGSDTVEVDIFETLLVPSEVRRRRCLKYFTRSIVIKLILTDDSIVLEDEVREVLQKNLSLLNERVEFLEKNRTIELWKTGSSGRRTLVA